MATLLNIREYYYRATTKVSENIRALAISEIGVIWLFKISDANKLVFPKGLQTPLLFCIFALFLDFTQYLYQNIAWDFKKSSLENTFKKKNLPIDINKDFPPMYAINIPSTILFYTKSVSFFVSYVLLLFFLLSNIIFN